MATQPDLFAALPAQPTATGAPARPSGPYFGPVYGWTFHPPGRVHTADTIRQLALATLADARAAKALTWTPGQVRSHTALFIFWAEWLKDGEGDRLLAEFKAEMDRLNAPADQVAPNWRRMWGLEG